MKTDSKRSVNLRLFNSGLLYNNKVLQQSLIFNEMNKPLPDMCFINMEVCLL